MAPNEPCLLLSELPHVLPFYSTSNNDSGLGMCLALANGLSANVMQAEAWQVLMDWDDLSCCPGDPCHHDHMGKCRLTCTAIR